MGGKSGSAVVGYRYHIGLHMALCHGPVDELQTITVGDRNAWSGNQSVNGTISINKPELFGGESREGGVVGDVDILLGDNTQTANAYLVAKAGADQPGYRNIASLIFKHIYYAAMNPYIKRFAFKIKRMPRGWYPEKATIGTDANPAHIIYECLTHDEWGMGYPASGMDSTTFQTAADTLFDEGFGLSLIWSAQDTIENFIQIIVDHINASLFTDPTTGLFVLNLIRGGYDTATLVNLDPSKVKKMDSFERPSWGETVNEITVIYRDEETNKDTPVTAPDIGNIRAQGQVVSQTKRYAGIRNAQLALRVAQRDLRALTTPLAAVKLTVNRTAHNLVPGGVFTLTWPNLGLNEVVFRIVEMNWGNLQKREIVIDAIEDVFSLPDSTYVQPMPISWTPPNRTPQPITDYKIIEVPYYTVIENSTEADRQYFDPQVGFGLLLAKKPSGMSINYSIIAGATSLPTNEVGTGNFVPYCELASAIAWNGNAISYENDVDFAIAETGLALLGDEFIEITGLDTVGKTLTVSRGVLDSIPRLHAAGTPLWVLSIISLDETERVFGETVYYKMLTRAPEGTLDINADTARSLSLNDRYSRPYPPGNVQINGGYFPASITQGQDTVISWAHRDREQQTAGYIEWTTGDIGPESGTNYRVDIYNDSAVLIRSESGITVNNYTYTEAQEIIDNGALSTALTIDITTVRGSLDSLESFSHTVIRTV